MNVFDRAKRRAFNVVEKTMGYRAVWGNIDEHCLFNYPTGNNDLSGAHYAPLDFVMEYRIDRFPTLFDLTRMGQYQNITIFGLAGYPNGRQFVTRQALGEYDGETYRIALEPAGS